MALYHRHVIHWELNIDDLVSYVKNPFFEYKLDPIFKVIGVTDDNCYMDIEVVESSFLAQGTVYTNQPTWGFKKSKLTPMNPDLTYNDSV